MHWGRLQSHICVCLFGSSTWLVVTAVFMQLPILVEHLPEQWNLASYLVLTVQCGSVAPLLFALLFKLIPTLRDADLTYFIVVLLAFACVNTGLLGAFWSYTVTLFQREHSVALFVLFFTLCCYCTLTNVVFLPHLARFQPELLTSFFVGMAVSAMVPSLTAAAQGVGQTLCVNTTDHHNHTTLHPEQLPARFGVSVYMYIMAVWLLVALLAFVQLSVDKKRSDRRAHKQAQPSNGAEATPLQNDDQQLSDDVSTNDDNQTDDVTAVVPCNESTSLSTSVYLYYLILTGCICALQNGVVPSIQIYACLPYGQNTYHATLVLSNIASPLLCCVPFCVRLRSIRLISLFTVVVFVIATLIVVLAAQSPTPIAAGTMAGSALTIISNTGCLSLLGYLRTVIASELRSGGDQDGSGRRLFWCGAATQIGSFLGAICMFPLINVWHLFTMADICAQQS